MVVTFYDYCEYQIKLNKQLAHDLILNNVKSKYAQI